MDYIADSMMNLDPENRGLVALRQLTFIQLPNAQMRRGEAMALSYANYNQFKKWISFYGPFVPTISLNDMTPVKSWQIYAEQIRTIIAPVSEKGEKRSLDQRVTELQQFLVENKEGFTNSINGKPLKENGPE